VTYDDRTLWKHLDGELSEAESATIEAAALDDPELAGRLARLRAVGSLVRAGAPKPPADFAERTVTRALAAPALLPELEEARRVLRRVLVAAAILAAVGLAYLATEIVPRLVDTPLLAGPLGE